MIKMIIKRLIRIYTPFIMALASIVHAVLFFEGYEGVAYSNLSSMFGFSLLASIYIMASSGMMCTWYKVTNYLLICVNVLSLIYTNIPFNGIVYLYIVLTLSILSVIAFIIYQFQKGIRKLLTE